MKIHVINTEKFLAPFEAGSAERYDALKLAVAVQGLVSRTIPDLLAGKTLPHTPILALWRECGGEMVTFGSDAHTPADVGADFADFVHMMKSCGFSSYFTFRGGEPVEHPLG